MEDWFADPIDKSLLLWIDDLLLDAYIIKEYMAAMEMLFVKMARYRLKFTVTQTYVYQQSVPWRDKEISAEGITDNPTRVRTYLYWNLQANCTDSLAQLIG